LKKKKKKKKTKKKTKRKMSKVNVKKKKKMYPWCEDLACDWLQHNKHSRLKGNFE